MSDYGRYEGDTRTRSRRAGPRGRASAFFDGPRDHEYRDNRPGGWAGDGRTSAYQPRRDRGGSRRDRYGRDDHRGDLPHDETSRLIASNKVEGTPVYSRAGDRLGTIYNFMVDKYSGRVDYAVMTHGGFLGLGQRFYPLPWEALDYERRAGGYVVDLSERDLDEAPSFGRDDLPRFDESYGQHVYGWYGLYY